MSRETHGEFIRIENSNISFYFVQSGLLKKGERITIIIIIIMLNNKLLSKIRCHASSEAGRLRSMSSPFLVRNSTIDDDEPESLWTSSSNPPLH